MCGHRDGRNMHCAPMLLCAECVHTEMVATDEEFLKRMKFVDYSLLIGIKRLSGRTARQRDQESGIILQE